MLKETRILNELGSLYESVNKAHALDSKVNFILEHNNLSFYTKTTLKNVIKQVVYNEQASNEEKNMCLDLFVNEINNNTLTEQRSQEILNEFIGRLGKWAADKVDAVRSIGQSIGSQFDRTGQGVVSSPAQSFANRLERIAKAIETLQKECTADGPGNVKISKWWAQLKSDPAGSTSEIVDKKRVDTTAMDRGNMPSGEFFKFMGSDDRTRDDRVKRFMRAISQILPSLVTENANPFITIGKELRTIAWNRKSRGPIKKTPEAKPETTPEAKPEAKPETTPEATPEATPKPNAPLSRVNRGEPVPRRDRINGRG